MATGKDHGNGHEHIEMRQDMDCEIEGPKSQDPRDSELLTTRTGKKPVLKVNTLDELPIAVSTDNIKAELWIHVHSRIRNSGTQHLDRRVSVCTQKSHLLLFDRCADLFSLLGVGLQKCEPSFPKIHIPHSKNHLVVVRQASFMAL